MRKLNRRFDNSGPRPGIERAACCAVRISWRTPIRRANAKVFRDYTGASFRTRSVPWNALPGVERQRKVGDREVLID